MLGLVIRPNAAYIFHTEIRKTGEAKGKSSVLLLPSNRFCKEVKL